jgi:L-malate glycosyltransferase
VASRVGGLPEVIEDGVTGFLCPLDGVSLMAERTVALLADADLRRRMGRRAADRVRTRFCASAIVPQYESYYREVLGTGA